MLVSTLSLFTCGLTIFKLNLASPKKLEEYVNYNLMKKKLFEV